MSDPSAGWLRHVGCLRVWCVVWRPALGGAVACGDPAASAVGTPSEGGTTTQLEGCTETDVLVDGRLLESAWMEPACLVAENAEDWCDALGLEGVNDFCSEAASTGEVEEYACSRPGDLAETIQQTWPALTGTATFVFGYADVWRQSVLAVEATLYPEGGYCCEARHVERIVFGPPAFRGSTGRVAFASEYERPEMCGSTRSLDEVCDAWGFWSATECPDFESFLETSGWSTGTGPGPFPGNVDVMQCEAESGGWDPYFNVVTWYDDSQWTAAFAFDGVLTFVERIDPTAGNETECPDGTVAIGETWGDWEQISCRGAPRWVRDPSGKPMGPEAWDPPYVTYTTD